MRARSHWPEDSRVHARAATEIRACQEHAEKCLERVPARPREEKSSVDRQFCWSVCPTVTPDQPSLCQNAMPAATTALEIYENNISQMNLHESWNKRWVWILEKTIGPTYWKSELRLKIVVAPILTTDGLRDEWEMRLNIFDRITDRREEYSRGHELKEATRKVQSMRERRVGEWQTRRRLRLNC